MYKHSTNMQYGDMLTSNTVLHAQGSFYKVSTQLT